MSERRFPYRGRLMTAIFVGVAFLSNVNAKSVFMEAEDFKGLAYYGNWANAKGWYAKRHSHASGGAFAVSHHAGAEMSAPVDLSAGQYQVYLRLCLTRSKKTRNLFTLAYKDGDTTKKQRLNLVQDFSGSGYGWYQMDGQLTVAQQCREITLTAAEVGNYGIGDDPEHSEPYAIFDSLLISDETVEITPVTRGRTKLTIKSGTDPRQKRARLPYTKLGADVHFESLRQRAPFLAKHNLLRNSSFEFALKPHYASIFPINNGYNVDSNCLTKERPYHGNYCVRLAARVDRPTLDYTGNQKALTHGAGFSLFALDKFLNKEIAGLATQSGLTVSMYVRGKGREITGKLADSKFVIDHDDWRRYEAPLQAKHLKTNLFTFSSPDEDAAVWVDAIQIECGNTATPYQSLDGLEVGFQLHARSHILHQGVPFNLEVGAVDDHQQPRELEVNYRILQMNLKTVHSGTFTLSTQPGQTVHVPKTIPFTRVGSYMFVYDVVGHPEQSYAFLFQVLPNPKRERAGQEPLLGTITSSNEEVMQIFSHAGVDWVTTLNDRLTYFAHHWPAKDDMRFFDKYWKMWSEKYGIEYVFWRPPFNPPGWANNPLGRQPAAHMGRPNISYENWELYWERITKHANYLKTWFVTDEHSYHRGPEEAAKYIEIATRVVRKNVPGATVVNSSQAVAFDEMLHLNPELDIGDAVGGSRHGFERNMYEYDRALKDKTGKDFWSVAVGLGAKSWYKVVNFETFSCDEKRYRHVFLPRAAVTVETLFNEAAIIGVERFNFYTAKFDSGRDPGSMFQGDNTFKPFAARYFNLVDFLRPYKPGGRLLLDRALGLQACYLYRDGKACVMLAPTRGYKSIEFTLSDTLRAEPAYDTDLNPVQLEASNRLGIGEVLFLQSRALDNESFLAAVRAIPASPDERRLVMGNGRNMNLTTLMMNGQGPKQTATAPFPADAGRRYPIDQARHTRNYAWAAVAAPLTDAKVDGKADETGWQNVAPNFIYCWPALDGSVGAFHGIEHFANIHNADDISVTFRSGWTAQHLLFYFDVADDEVQAGDGVTIRLDGDLLGDLNSPVFDADDVLLTVSTKDGTGAVTNGFGKRMGQFQAAFQLRDTGYQLEVAIPWAALGSTAKAQNLGLGIEISDQDGSEPTTVLSWTGNYAPRNSPLGFGQLVVVP